MGLIGCIFCVCSFIKRILCMMTSRFVVCWLLCLAAQNRGEQSNVSSKEATTCDANGIDGCDVINQFETGKFIPFQPDGNLKGFVRLDKLFQKYIKWHNKTLFDSTIPCNKKKLLVFNPIAGLGDSIGHLKATFKYAIRSGRLFFIAWKPYEWSVGFKSLPFQYDYAQASALTDPSTDKPLICVDKHNDKGSFIIGYPTQAYEVVNETAVNDIYFSNEDMTRALLQPSPKVEAIVDQVINSRFLSNDDNKEYINRLVAIVIRTGKTEYNQFLSEGDEMNFVACFRNYAKNHIKGRSSKVKFRVFVTSDNEEIKQNVVNELETGDNGDVIIDVVTLNDSIIHVMHVEEKDTKKTSVRDKIRKTYAEFFLIGSCDVLFLTHGSLFGRAATENGKVRASNIHYISDSNCDGKREKFSYVHCRKPKYPDVCGFS